MTYATKIKLALVTGMALGALSFLPSTAKAQFLYIAYDANGVEMGPAAMTQSDMWPWNDAAIILQDHRRMPTISVAERNHDINGHGQSWNGQFRLFFVEPFCQGTPYTGARGPENVRLTNYRFVWDGGLWVAPRTEERDEVPFVRIRSLSGFDNCQNEEPELIREEKMVEMIRLDDFDYELPVKLIPQ